MPASPSALDPTRCPLCGAINQCAMEVERETGDKQSPCWCTQIDFSKDLLARLPEESVGLACICQACAQTQATLPGQ